MASNASGLAWASFIAGLGRGVPDMLRQYNADTYDAQARQKKAAAEAGASKLLQDMPQYGDMPAGMSPDQAMDTWLKSSPEDKMKATSMLGGQPTAALGKMAALPPVPGASTAGGNALQALANPSPAGLDEDTTKGLLDVIGGIEGGGRYDAQHPKAANGLQAVGKYGIVPSVWFKNFPQYGLNPDKPEDVQRFVGSPGLQDAMAKDLVKQLWGEAGGDPRKFIARYYSGSDSAVGTPNEWKPQFAYKRTPGRAVREKVQMPSIGEHADKFMKAAEALGLSFDGQAAAPTGPAGAPYDNAALMDLIKEKPKMKQVGKRVSYQDQERYLLSNAKNPEQLALLKDFMGNISKLAASERDQEKDARTEFAKESDRYEGNVVEASKQALEVWKTRFNAANQRKVAGSKAKDEHRMYLKDLSGRMQQRLKDISSWQLNFVKADDEQKQVLASQFPEFFSQQPETSFFGGTKMVPKLSVNEIEKEVNRLREQINATEAELAPRAGVGFMEPAASRAKPPQDFYR